MSAGGILVLDDNPENLKLVLHFLTAKGYATRGVASTREADLALAAERPALAIVDVALPHEDGLNWVLRTRGRPGAPDHFVALTAQVDPGVQARAHEVGCSAYLTKPVPLKALLAVVEACVGRSAPRPG